MNKKLKKITAFFCKLIVIMLDIKFFAKIGFAWIIFTK